MGVHIMKKALRLVVFFSLGLWAGPSLLAEEAKDVPLPQSVVSLLEAIPSMTNRHAFETNGQDARFSRWWRQRDEWSYELAVSFMKRSHFPDVTRCERVKVAPPVNPLLDSPGLSTSISRGFVGATIRTGTTNQFLGLWLGTNQNDQPVVMAADFQPVPLDDLPRLHLSPANLRDELVAAGDLFARRLNVTNQPWNVGLSSIARLRSWDDSTTIKMQVMSHLLICGTWLGLTNEVDVLLQSVSFRFYFTNTLAADMRARANQTWETGLTNLQGGRALQEVFKPWSEHVHVFGTNVVPELPELVSALESQLDEYQRLHDSAVEDPARLPPDERAKYYLARLSQAQRQEGGAGSFKAGSPMPELLAMGKDALPALIAHLEDRRLTRMAGNQETKVVLVQDLVLECVERIGGGGESWGLNSFRTNYQYSGKFSVLPKSARDAIVRQARDWFDRYGSRHPAVAALALAEAKPVSLRIRLLEDLERRYGGAVDGIAYLRRWAANTNSDNLRMLAWQLGRRGDTSLLPEVRKEVVSGRYENCDYLAAFGSPSDFILLRHSIQRHLMDGNTLPLRLMVDPVSEITAGNRTNSITAAYYGLPVLVDLLECRRGIGVGQPSRTLADEVFPALLKITGQTNDYAKDAPIAARMNAMDVWLAWWEGEGRGRFAEQHPDLISLFGKLGPLNALDAGDRVPDTALITPANPEIQADHFMSRDDALRLAKKRQISLHVIGDVAIGRFLSAVAEQNWLAGSHATPSGSGSHPATNFPAAPATRIHLRSFPGCSPWQDAAGKMWCQMDGDNRGASFNDNWTWKRTPLPITETYPGPLFAAPLTDGALLLEFEGPPTTFAVFQESGSFPFQSLDDLMRRQGTSLSKALPYPNKVAEQDRQRPSLVRTLVKDAVENMWWVQARANLFVDVGGRIVRQPLRDLGVTADAPALMPIGDDSIILLKDGSGGAWLLKWTGTAITNMATIKAASRLISPSQLEGPALVRTHGGNVWINGYQPLLVNAEGSAVATNTGTVWFEDQDRRLWSRLLKDRLPQVCCTLENGRSLVSQPMDIRGRPVLDTDGLVWVPTKDAIVCLKIQRDKMVEVLNWPCSIEFGNALWIDKANTIWVTQGRSSEFLICLPQVKFAP
jgi:hypothetical protein